MKRKLLVIFITILAFNTNAQEWELLKNKTSLILNGSSNADNFIKFNEKIYFTANDGVHGNELWVTDGTETGTEMVKDIYAGFSGSNIQGFTEFDNNLFFWAETKDYGRELWKTNGTSSGTKLVEDIYQGIEGNTNNEMYVFNNKLYFGYGKTEIIKTGSGRYCGSCGSLSIYSLDDSESLPIEIKEIISSKGYFITDFINTTTHLFFKIKGTNSNQIRVYSTDGTTDGTIFLSASNQNGVSEFAVLNNKIYYYLDTGYDEYNQNWDLYESNGTSDGTLKKVDLYGSYPTSRTYNDNTIEVYELIAYNDKLYFNSRASSYQYTYYLYESNLTQQGTIKVLDENSEEIVLPNEFYEFNNNLYFNAKNSNNRVVLWQSDGTIPNTVIFKEGEENDSFTAKNHINLNDRMIFNVENTDSIFESDGTISGTMESSLFKNLPNPELHNIAELNNYIYVNATNDKGSEVWTTSYSGENTCLLKDIYGNYNDGSRPYNFIFTNNKFYFTEDNYLWESDGTTINTKIFKDSNNNELNIKSEDLVFNNNKYFFRNSSELWSVDFSSSVVQQVKDVDLRSDLISVNNKIFFTAYNDDNFNVLWSSDGTEEGTQILKTIGSSRYRIGGNPRELTKVGNKFFFQAVFYNEDTNVSNGNELGISDGTTGGTKMLKDIVSGSTGTAISHLTSADNLLFFTANDAVNGTELWVSDGTESGTKLVKDISSGESSANPYPLITTGNKVFFMANDGTNNGSSFGKKLWVSDGTEIGTKLLKGNDGYFSYSNFTTYRDMLFFSIKDVVLDTYEYWVSDGTVVGTKNLNEYLEINDEITGGLLVANNKLYFTAYNNQFGSIVYETDGTKVNTKVFSKEILSLNELFEFNSEIYGVTFKPLSGHQIYKYNPNGNSFITNGDFSDPSNWSKGVVPENLGDINVESGVRITLDVDDLQMQSFTLGNNATIIIPEDKELTITGNFTTDGNLEIGSNNSNSGVLLLKGNVTGEITYKRGGLKANKWSLVTPPVSGQKIKEFATNTDNDIRTNETVSPVRYAVGFYDDAQDDGNEWVYYDTTIDENQTFTAGQSYAISRATDGAVSFTGTLTTSNLTRTLQPGEWNAIGNPFTTYYPANKNGASSFINDNYDILDDNFKGIYVWDNTQNKYVAASETDIENKSLTPGQGFFIKVKEGEFEIDFNEAKRTLKPVTGDTDFNKTQQKYIQLFADNGSNKVETNIKFFENATNGFDVGLDIGNFDATFDLFTKLVDFSNAKNYTIQSLPNELNEDVIIPLGVSASNMEVVFSTKHLNLELSTSLYLEDKFTKSFVDITNENDTYTVNFSDSDIAKDRFYLHILPNKSLNVESNIYDNLKVYSNNKILYVRGLKAVSKMEIINTIGQKVFVKSLNSDEDINLSNLKTGVYMIKLNSNNGNYVKKVILN